jgi:SAM-dependent methyltransferase
MEERGMFKFVTKAEYWSILDSGITSQMPKKFDWHLKSVQDAVALSHLHETTNSCLAEIGGGDSRVLSMLAKQNTCYNIEEFQGEGAGPKKEVRIPGVTNIKAKIGRFSESIKHEQFDAIFSISVVEHVVDKELVDFFRDCHRILKPSGLMIHLIDVYLEELDGDNKNASRRVLSYGSHLDNKFFAPVEIPLVLSEQDVYFRPSFVTNPDNVMYSWNQIAPQLKSKRERAQSCTLLMISRKILTPKE